jgi:hypothetical protein
MAREKQNTLMWIPNFDRREAAYRCEGVAET